MRRSAPSGDDPAGRDGTAGLLRAAPLFSQIDPAELAEVAARTRARGLDRGQLLFRAGDPARGFFVMVEGVVKLGATEADGGEKVIEIMHPGDTFGEAAMLLGRPFPVTATALEPTRLLAVPLDVVESLLVADPMFARRMMAGLAVRLHTMVQDTASYALRSGRERVAAYLVAAAAQTAPAAPQPRGGQAPLVVTLPTSKQVTASRLGLTPATFSRALRDLSDRKLIAVDGRRITILDVEALIEA